MKIGPIGYPETSARNYSLPTVHMMAVLSTLQQKPEITHNSKTIAHCTFVTNCDPSDVSDNFRGSQTVYITFDPAVNILLFCLIFHGFLVFLKVDDQNAPQNSTTTASEHFISPSFNAILNKYSVVKKRQFLSKYEYVKHFL